MIKNFLLAGLLFCCYLCGNAQYTVEVSSHKPQKVEVSLRDYAKSTDNYLMNLPLTFNITDKNILMIMIGDDTSLDYDRKVWIFSKDMELTELMKKDKNVNASKLFKNQNKVLNKFLSYHEKIRLFRPFEDGYEIIKKNAKPIFLEILNPSANQTLIFSMQFYITQPDPNYPNFFIAKCKPIEIEITIKK